MKITGTIKGRVIDGEYDKLAPLMREIASSPAAYHLAVGGRVLDIGALPIAPSIGEREPTDEELQAALL